MAVQGEAWSFSKPILSTAFICKANQCLKASRTGIYKGESRCAPHPHSPRSSHSDEDFTGSSPQRLGSHDSPSPMPGGPGPEQPPHQMAASLAPCPAARWSSSHTPSRRGITSQAGPCHSSVTPVRASVSRASQSHSLTLRACGSGFCALLPNPSSPSLLLTPPSCSGYTDLPRFPPQDPHTRFSLGNTQKHLCCSPTSLSSAQVTPRHFPDTPYQNLFSSAPHRDTPPPPTL